MKSKFITLWPISKIIISRDAANRSIKKTPIDCTHSERWREKKLIQRFTNILHCFRCWWETKCGAPIFLFVGNAFAVCGVYGNESVARTATVWKIWSKWRLRTPSENHQADKRFWCRAFCRITNTLSPIIFNSRLPKWQVNMVTVTGFPSNYFY